MGQKRSLNERILEHIVAEIPDELARCEFDCPKWACLQNDWANCAKRLQMMEAIQSSRDRSEGDDDA